MNILIKLAAAFLFAAFLAFGSHLPAQAATHRPPTAASVHHAHHHHRHQGEDHYAQHRLR